MSDIRDRREELIDRIARRVVEMRLGMVAIVMLESAKPISFLGNQAMIFFQPFYRTFFTSPLYDEFASLLEDRENIELLIQRIEKYEEEYERKERAQDDPGH
ncbi:hypothetical protein DRP53_07185 [candidate division WOR-3 bacterium]|uniref:Uncharacterized protein n=1 Tax=candidate division WOR-3 bacterium TaxID=2052148 RepID=A0A660SG28_UNCW3|nr:MAG: hypothetical protein DRP53_07185 [candidate division WOR-3 bacterium]